jgi:hypothetical protein
MVTICSSEASVDLHRIIRRYIPEDGTLHNHRYDNLRSNVDSEAFHNLYSYTNVI